MLYCKPCNIRKKGGEQSIPYIDTGVFQEVFISSNMVNKKRKDFPYAFLFTIYSSFIINLIYRSQLFVVARE